MLDAWATKWLDANRDANGSKALATSVARMPFTCLQSAAFDAVPVQQQEALRQQRKPILVLLAKEDPIITGVNTDIYRDIFGGVTVETWKGRHSFFLQDSDRVHDRIIEWLDKNAVVHTSDKVPGYGDGSVITAEAYHKHERVISLHPGGPRGCYDGGLPPE